MPSVKEELEALRNKGVTKKNASKLKDASGLSTPESAERSIKKERLRVANYGKEADTNLKSYNEAKLAASAATSTPTPTPTEQVTAPAADTAVTADDDVPLLDEIDDVPLLEEVPDLEEMPDNIAGGGAPGTAAAAAPREINRAERKARRVMEKLNMKKVDGIKQCVLKMRNGASGGRGGIFTINLPTTYVSNNGNSYVVFGEARQGGPQDGLGGGDGAGGVATGAQQAQAIQQLAALAKQQGGGATADGSLPSAGDAATNDSSLKIEEINEDEDEAADENGLDKKDIELVLSQAGCSRSKAIKALKDNDGDLVNTIMSLTA